eukprot:SAG31_NODE_833_length_11657_cov_3.652535_4_plen_131_part_00
MRDDKKRANLRTLADDVMDVRALDPTPTTYALTMLGSGQEVWVPCGRGARCCCRIIWLLVRLLKCISARLLLSLLDPEDYLREQDKRLGLNTDPPCAQPDPEAETQDPADFADAFLEDVLKSSITDVSSN